MEEQRAQKGERRRVVFRIPHHAATFAGTVGQAAGRIEEGGSDSLAAHPFQIERRHIGAEDGDGKP